MSWRAPARRYPVLAIRDFRILLIARLLAPGAQDRVAAVASDREQPRPQVHLAVARDEIVVGREEGVLDRILGLLRTTEHVAAEGQNLAMVTVIQRLEGGSSALPDKVDEMCVAGDTQ